MVNLRHHLMDGPSQQIPAMNRYFRVIQCIPGTVDWINYIEESSLDQVPSRSYSTVHIIHWAYNMDCPCQKNVRLKRDIQFI
jgi:hypothetical protein